MLSVDHKISPDAKAPITVLDLTRPSDQTILQDIIKHKPPQYVHFGLPCGTCSRARDRPVSQALQSQGAPNPAQLRSAEFPLGLPSIPTGSINYARVMQANMLYDFAVALFTMLLAMDCVISFENPKRSWFWAAMIQLLLRRQVQSTIAAWNKLDEVDFDACCFGSTRQKPTRGSPLPESLRPCDKHAQVITSMSHITSLQLTGTGNSTPLEKQPIQNLCVRLSPHAC